MKIYDKNELLQKPICDVIDIIAAEPRNPRFSCEDVKSLLAKNPLQFYSAVANGNKPGDVNGSKPMTVSALLNDIVEDDGSGLDGFERMLRHLGINLRNDASKGVYVGTMDLFFTADAGTALVPEFISRTLREVAEDISWDVNSLIAEHVYTPNGSYREPKLDLSNLDAGMGDVAAGAELPEIFFAFTENAKTINKKGCVFRTTYEAIRRTPINLFQLALKRVAIASNSGLMTKLVSVLINGAGSTQTKNAINSNDTNGSHSLLYETWLKFIRGVDGLRYSKVVGDIDAIIAVLLAAKPSVDPIQLLSYFAAAKSGIMGELLNMQNKQWGEVELIVHDSVSQWSLVAVDPRYAAVEVTEIGAEIVEKEQIVARQIKGITITNANDFYVNDPTSIKIMTNI